jgi:GntR family transcriptional regulator, transcriptional repressor for pyruvate dehydrogenase complex
MPANKIRQKTVVEQVMAQIKSLISSGKYKPGDKIPTELELAETFGVGRSSIREAIKIFNYLGVLKSQAAKGTFVQERSHISTEALTWSVLLGNDEFEEMIDLRGAIELWSIFSLTKRVGKGSEQAAAVLEELWNIVENMEKSVKAGAGAEEKLILEDFHFHGTIIKAQGNAQFYSLYQTLRSFLFEEIRKSHSNYADPFLIPKEHREITEAIASGNPQEVFVIYIDHIVNIKQRIKDGEKR